MRIPLLPAAISLAALTLATAQSPPQPTQNLITLPSGERLFVWQGHPGRSYFLQVSDPTSHLEKWFWAPVIEAGTGAEVSYEYGGTADKAFFRLAHTDKVPGSGETLDTADFDGDGLSNLAEISPPSGSQTNPLEADTDGDTLPDGWEIAHGLDPNDDGTTNPHNGASGSFQNSSTTNGSAYSQGVSANPGATLEDHDADGFTNAQEAIYATDPQNPDSDGDGLIDSLDGWAMDANLQYPRISKNYVILDLSGDLPISADPEAEGNIEIDNRGGVLYATTKYLHDGWSYTGAETTAKYSRGGNLYGVDELPYFNKQIDYPYLYPFHNEIRVGLTGNGELYYSLHFELGWGEVWSLPFSQMVEKMNIESGVKSVAYDLQGFKNYVIGGYTFVHFHMAPSGEAVMSLEADVSDYEGLGIHAPGNHGPLHPDDEIYPYALKIGSDPVIEKELTIAETSGQNAGTISAGISYSIGRNGTKIIREMFVDGSGADETFHDLSSPGLDAAALAGTLPGVTSVGDTADMLSWQSTKEYSADRGATRHPFRIVIDNALVNVALPGGPASDEFILAYGDSLILNQRKTPIGELITNPAGWSGYAVNGINKHGQVVGNAVKDGTRRIVTLLPVEVAPEVLAVNSDFDEGRIDPTTGYAIPDCDDANIALEAKQDHLDGKFSANERITDDMHPGFFGVNPSQLDDAFWDGANVTIRKVDKTDPSTGHPESGHIRLYGKWGDGPSEYRAIIPYDFDTLATTNLADGGINGAPGESVYGSASAFPAGTSYFIEGVHPGKITLEWRYQKGSVDFKHEQEFEVYTKKTASQWRFDLDYKIRLETLNEPSGEIRTIEYPLLSDGYEANIERAAEFYDFYRECFQEPLRSHATGYPHPMSWPGLARLAGSQVIGGLSDSEWGRRALLPGAVIASPILTIITPYLQDWTENEIEQLQVALFQGGWQIFTSVGWQHHAFRSSGYEAIEWVATETEDVEAPLMLSAWGDLRQGILDHDKALIDSAASEITDREQNHTIVPTWTTISGLGLGLVDDIFSVLGKNSCSPSGLDFTDLFDVAYLPRSTPPKPMGNLANAANRWTWIDSGTPGGILDTWETETLARKLSLSGDSLKSDAERFSLFSGPSSPVPVLSWDHLDVP